MNGSSKDAARRATILGHLAMLPLWALRVLADPWRFGWGIVLLLILDALLAVQHFRANRKSDRADPVHFGENYSWTKFLYIPELFAVFCFARDLWQAFTLLRD